MAEFSMEVNGARRTVQAAPDETLLSVLRDRLDLTGSKYGCGEGQCGACTVLLNGRAVRACQTTVQQASGAKVVTVEGLEHDGKLTPVQAAFLETEAFQCGYCTPGMIMGATALLAQNGSPSVDQIRAGMNGHICRCGTYPRIVEAVRMAARLGAQGGTR
jgi:aerobic-type carbon monoxide dehydrogenase small subunit (CoxS/CutS family)